MRYKVFSIYDRAAEVFTTPMFFPTEEMAIRAFKATVKPGTLLYDFPEDYKLVWISEFDDKECIFYNLDEMKDVIFAEGVKNEIQRSGEPEEPIED